MDEEPEPEQVEVYNDAKLTNAKNFLQKLMSFNKKEKKKPLEEKLIQYKYCRVIQNNKVMIKAKVLEHTIGIMDIIMVLLYFVYCLFS